MARTHLINAIHQIERRSTATNHFAIHILAAKDAAVAFGYCGQKLEEPPVILNLSAQAPKLRRVGGIEDKLRNPLELGRCCDALLSTPLIAWLPRRHSLPTDKLGWRSPTGRYR